MSSYRVKYNENESREPRQGTEGSKQQRNTEKAKAAKTILKSMAQIFVST